MGVNARDTLSDEEMLGIGGESELGPGCRAGETHDEGETEGIRITGNDVGEGAFDRRLARLVWCRPNLEDSAEYRLRDLCPEA